MARGQVRRLQKAAQGDAIAVQDSAVRSRPVLRLSRPLKSHTNYVSLERGRGIATRLVSELINEIGDDARITLEVRPSNTPAIRLYEGLGFLAAGHRRAYYADTGEDAVIMWRTPSTLVGRLDDVPNAEVQER